MTEEQTKAEAEVKRAVLDSWVAWRNRDMEAWKRVIHPEFYGYYFSAGLLAESGAGDQLYDGVRAWWEAGQRSTMSPSHIAVRLEGKEAAIATYYLQGSESYPDGRSIEGTWRATVVLTKDSGAWRNVHYHLSPLTASQSERRSSDGSDSSVARNQAAVRRIIEEVWHKGNLAVVDELLDTDFVFHGAPSTKAVLRGREAYKQIAAAYRKAFPDLRYTIE